MADSVETQDQEEPEFRYTDKRLMATSLEIANAAHALCQMFTDWQIQPAKSDYAQVKGLDLTMQLGSGSGSTEASRAREQLIVAALQAINFKRLGYAEGTVARNRKDGRTAKRYYDRVFCCLRWIIWQNEHSEPTAERVDNLGNMVDEWEIIHHQQWQVSPQYSSQKLPI